MSMSKRSELLNVLLQGMTLTFPLVIHSAVSRAFLNADTLAQKMNLVNVNESISLNTVLFENVMHVVFNDIILMTFV